MQKNIHKWLYMCAAIAVLGYLAWPYGTLFRLYIALNTGDRDAVETAFVWPSVRNHMRADLNSFAKTLVTKTATKKINEANWIKNLSLTWKSAPAVDRISDILMTPDGIIALFENPNALACFTKALSPGTDGMAINKCYAAHIKAKAEVNKAFELSGPKFSRIAEKTNWAFFTGPLSFKLDVAHEGARIALNLERIGAGWKVTRISLPLKADIKPGV
ncbi:MAG: DUF2939 domain-containing protein [Rhodospirillales bacterium]|nr:DUF2939 domain-containing protein [Rhodospirillales bacterium]